MRRDAVVVNQVHPLYSDVAPQASDLAASLASHLPATMDPSVTAEHLRRSLAEEQLRGLADRREADSLRKHVGHDVVFVEVPAFEADVHDLRALARVAGYLTGTQVGSAA